MHPPRRRLFWTWLLPAVLIGAQWLALAHGVLHVRGMLPIQAAVSGVADAQESAATSWLARLLGQHDDSGACRLYDQSAGGDHAPAVPAADLPACGAPSPAPRWVQRAWAARLVPHFSARAPPLAA
ncbi:MAG: hypothetical protein JSS18_02800 [Proteobacteria bacterium]|nr:hypothetical protein [Pseudomonadota bacterium]